MKRYKISVLCGSERSDVVMELRPTELKTIERLDALFLARLEEAGDDVPWMDIEEV